MIEKTGLSIKDAIPIKSSDELHKWVDKNLGEFGKDWQYPPDFNCNIYSNSSKFDYKNWHKIPPRDKSKPIYIGKVEAMLSDGTRKTIYFDGREYFKNEKKMKDKLRES